jgi:hypothetical protein
MLCRPDGLQVYLSLPGCMKCSLLLLLLLSMLLSLWTLLEGRSPHTPQLRAAALLHNLPRPALPHAAVLSAALLHHTRCPGDHSPQLHAPVLLHSRQPAAVPAQTRRHTAELGPPAMVAEACGAGVAHTPDLSSCRVDRGTPSATYAAAQMPWGLCHLATTGCCCCSCCCGCRWQGR